jgi:hypothetical protein
MAWKRYNEMSSHEKALKSAKKKVTNSIMSPETKKRMREEGKKRTISTDWS